jgi:hypothetical protein
MTMLIYSAVAISFLILVVILLRNSQPLDAEDSLTETACRPNLGNGRWIDLSERIFDPSDARWLREELAFPTLANALIVARRRLAIHWLEALQASFNEVVRVREVATSEARSPGSWHMLWLIVRFKLLLAYALFVVKVFGPYHRLIPSFSWLPVTQETGRSIRQPALANGRSVH